MEGQLRVDEPTSRVPVSSTPHDAFQQLPVNKSEAVSLRLSIVNVVGIEISIQNM